MYSCDSESIPMYKSHFSFSELQLKVQTEDYFCAVGKWLSSLRAMQSCLKLLLRPTTGSWKMMTNFLRHIGKCSQ